MRIEFEDGQLENIVGEGIRAKCMEGAIKLIMEQITPERLQVFVQHTLEEACRDVFGGWKMREAINKLAEPMIDQIVRDSAVKLRVQQAVAQGMDEAISRLPDNVRASIIQAAVLGIEGRNR